MIVFRPSPKKVSDLVGCIIFTKSELKWVFKEFSLFETKDISEKKTLLFDIHPIDKVIRVYQFSQKETNT